MTLYNVFDNTTGEHFRMPNLSSAKQFIKERLSLGHDAGGSKTKIYSNGDWVPCGDIELSGSNKVFVANTQMTKKNY